MKSKKAVKKALDFISKMGAVLITAAIHIITMFME